MMSTAGSGKWVLAVFVAILLVVGWAFPQETLFVSKFIWDLISMNAKALFDSISQMVHSH